jgi:hypothetical protein
VFIRNFIRFANEVALARHSPQAVSALAYSQLYSFRGYVAFAHEVTPPRQSNAGIAFCSAPPPIKICKHIFIVRQHTAKQTKFALLST